MIRFNDNFAYLGERKIVKFPYFVVINEKNDFNHKLERKKLGGDADGNLKLWTFNKIYYYQALRYIRKNNIRHWKPRSLVSQFRITTQDKYFDLMYPKDYNDLDVLTFDIESTGLDSKKDKVFLIIAHHSKFGIQIFRGKEHQILRDFQYYLSTHDFDVLVGHNIVTFDIPFLIARGKKYNIEFIWGEDGSPAYISEHFSGFQYRYGRFSYKKVFIKNKEIVDTMFLVMAYDMIKREFASYKLKELELELGLIDPNNRVYMSEKDFLVGKLTEKMRKYCQQDVESTMKLYHMFIPSYYYQLLYFPMSLQDIVFNTIVPKWDSAIIIDYLNQDMSIPLPINNDEIIGGKFEGAITGCLKKGKIKHVRKIDVASLYPSIIIKHHIKSDKDYLDVAYNKFVKITKDRLWYKARKKENKLYDYIQSALKYIINPYFGYLGNEYSLYSNLDGAAKVTEYGRYYITEILKYMEEFGAEIIEIDTDGVIYSGPKLADKINQKLPKEIQVEDEGFWSQMISYSKKNYILYVGKRNWVKKGVFFKSSSMNGLKKTFVDDIIHAIFENESVLEVLDKYYLKIMHGDCTADELKQRFRASMTLEEYEQSLLDNKNKNPQLPYEYFKQKNKPFKLEEVVYLYKARTGKKYLTMESVEDFNGVYDTKYYLKMLFGFIEKIYKTAPEILPQKMLDKYHEYRYIYTGVKSKEYREMLKKKEEKND